MGDYIDADDARQDLADGLAKDLIAGYPEGKSYIPRDRFEARIDRDAIRQCLPDVPESLLNFVSNSAPRIFAILLYSGCIPVKIGLQAALQACKDSELTDAKLPFPRQTEKCDCYEDAAVCRHRVAGNVLKKWRESGWQKFYTTQWQFLALEFKAGDFDYVLDEQSILPIARLEGHGEGSFGDVVEGELNKHHIGALKRVSLRSMFLSRVSSF